MGVAPVAGDYFNFGGAHQTLPGVAGDETFHHKWTVPAGLAPGVYTSRVRYYSSASNHGPLPITDFDANWDSEGSQRFTVKQPLQIFKYNDLDGNGQDDSEPFLNGWNFTVTGPASAGWPFSGNVLGTPSPTNQDFTGNGLTPGFPLAGDNLYVNGVNVGAYTLTGNVFHLAVAAGFTPVAGQTIVNNEFSGQTSGTGFLVLPDIDTIGNYTITETLQPNWTNTQPGTLTRVVHIPGDIGIGPGLIDPSDPTVFFGNQELFPDTTSTIFASPDTVSDGGGDVTLYVTEHNDISSVPLNTVSVDVTGGTTPYTLTRFGNIAPVTFTGGDSTNIGILDPNETWSWTISPVPVTATTIFQADGHGHTGTPATPENDITFETTHTGERSFATVDVLPPRHVPGTTNLGIGIMIAGFATLGTILIYRRSKRSQTD